MAKELEEQAWLEELDSLGRRSNLIAGVAAFILIPFHIITTDYIDVNERFSSLSIGLRLTMAFSTLILVLLQYKINIRSIYFSYITFFIVSIGDGYMSAIATQEALSTHLLGYCLVLIGTNMWFFWKVKHAIISILISMSAVAALFYFKSSQSLYEIERHGGFFTLFIAVLSMVLMWRRYSLQKQNFLANRSLLKSKEIIESNRQELEIQNKLLAEKNLDITSSIHYAKRIQEAILPEHDEIDNAFEDFFIFYRPKDIVSGDFYWFHRTEEKIIVAAADCTGHGVPGAFMSMIGYTQLNKIVVEQGITEASEILALLNKEVIKALNQTGHHDDSRDGMDIALVVLDLKNSTASFSGANRPLFYIKAGQLEVIKGTPYPIGGNFFEGSGSRPYESHKLDLAKGDKIYLFSDGYVDQFGGPDNKKFMVRRFKDLILDIKHIPLSEQKEHFENSFDQWRSTEEQVDDVLVMGIQM